MIRLLDVATSVADTISESVSAVESSLAETTAAGATTGGGFGEVPVIKQIAWVFGLLMQGIFIVLSNMGILSVTMCIIVFTVITKMLLLPLTIKQQKSTKVTALVTPEVQALQKKYEGRRDAVSMQQMRTEQQQIYEKYGTSMTAGCLPSLIQLPLLFGLYPVIYNMQYYVPQMANYTVEEISKMYTLFGINLLEAPGWRITPAIIIPILAGVSSWLTTKLSTPKNSDNSPAAGMKTMSLIMPFMSLFFCISLPAFLGVYWVISSIVTIIQQWLINRHYNKIPVEDLIKQNIEKANKKRARKGLPPINEKAAVNAKKIKTGTKTDAEIKDAADKRAEGIKQSTEYYSKKAGSSGGSLAAKANMVKDYNEKHK